MCIQARELRSPARCLEQALGSVCLMNQRILYPHPHPMSGSYLTLVSDPACLSGSCWGLAHPSSSSTPPTSTHITQHSGLHPKSLHLFKIFPTH